MGAGQLTISGELISKFTARRFVAFRYSSEAILDHVGTPTQESGNRRAMGETLLLHSSSFRFSVQLGVME